MFMLPKRHCCPTAAPHASAMRHVGHNCRRSRRSSLATSQARTSAVRARASAAALAASAAMFAASEAANAAFNSAMRASWTSASNPTLPKHKHSAHPTPHTLSPLPSSPDGEAAPQPTCQTACESAPPPPPPPPRREEHRETNQPWLSR